MKIRTLVKVVVFAAVAACAVMGTSRAMSYFKTSRNLVQRAIDDSTPMEFHLERLQTMMNELTPEIARNREALANAEVDVKDLEQEIARSTLALEQAKERILRRRQLLATEDEVLYIGGQGYTREAVTAELELQVDSYNAQETALTSKRELLDARRKVVAAARTKVTQFDARRRGLDLQIAQLTSQLRLVEARHSANHHLTLDGAKLSEAESLAKSLKRKLDVAEQVIASSLPPANVPEDGAGRRNVLKEVDQKFDIPARAAALPEPTSTAADRRR